jgi:hypothetical protein
MVAGDYGWPDSIASVRQVVQALDLGLQVPLALAMAFLLWQRRPAGYLLAAITLTMSVGMAVALTAMVGVRAIGERASLAATLPFAGLTLVAAVLCATFFRAVKAGAPSSILVAIEVSRA